MSLSELNVKDFVEQVSADSPAPGGGSVAGLEAALGAALGLMVVRLTQGREKYAHLASHAAEVEKKLITLKAGLMDAMERDCAAFNEVSAAFHMPRGTDEEKARRSTAIQKGLRACTEAPLGLMKLCAEGLTLVESMMGRCNDTCVSDLGAAAVSLKAGLMGAWLNVRVNIAWLKDKEFARVCREKGEKLLAHATPVADRCYAGALVSCK